MPRRPVSSTEYSRTLVSRNDPPTAPQDHARPGVDHPERDQPDVRQALEGVGPDTGRHPVDPAGLDRPVQEGQVAPVWFIITRAAQRGAPRRRARRQGRSRFASLGAPGPNTPGAAGQGT